MNKDKSKSESKSESEYKILCVCLGNICRSPTAAGILQQQITAHAPSPPCIIDSAGLGDWHTGHAPDPRAQAVAARHGIDLSARRARAVHDADLVTFDYILAMDQQNLTALQRRAPATTTAQITLLPHPTQPDTECEIPDPYYGDEGDFVRMFELLELTCARFLATLPTLPPPA